VRAVFFLSDNQRFMFFGWLGRVGEWYEEVYGNEKKEGNN